MPKAPKSKNNDKKVLHPHSRKAWQLARQEHHENRKDSRRGETNIKLNSAGEKLMWFKTSLSELPRKECYDKSDVTALVEKYLARFDQEREQISIVNSIKGRHGRMHASREDNIRFIQEKELSDFDTAGLEIPDLFNKGNVEYLRNWNGELRYLCNILMKAVTREGLTK